MELRLRILQRRLGSQWGRHVDGLRHDKAGDVCPKEEQLVVWRVGEDDDVEEEGAVSELVVDWVGGSD